MALADIIIPRREIPVLNTTVKVRPLCVDDVLMALLADQDRVQRAASMYDEIVGDRKDDGAMTSYLIAVMEELPDLAARIVAYACDEPEQWQTVLSLPAPAQTELVFAIFELTFSEPDSLKTFAARVSQALAAMSKK